jgi:hypothetical protein
MDLSNDIREYHPVVDDLTLKYEALEPPGDSGQTIFVYIAEPKSSSQEALDLLASWTATSPDMSRADAEHDVEQLVRTGRRADPQTR